MKKDLSAVVFVTDDRHRAEILKLNGMTMEDGTSLTVDGRECRFTNQIMDILEVHTSEWSGHWKADNRAQVKASAEAIKTLIERIK